MELELSFKVLQWPWNYYKNVGGCSYASLQLYGYKGGYKGLKSFAYMILGRLIMGTYRLCQFFFAIDLQNLSFTKYSVLKYITHTIHR